MVYAINFMIYNLEFWKYKNEQLSEKRTDIENINQGMGFIQFPNHNVFIYNNKFHCL